MSDVVACSWCGATADATTAEVSLGWTVSVEAGRVRRYCPTCARTHLRSIEARLDAPDW